jgi:uncharacterized protein YjbI with pentapeptide repeats
LVAIVTFSFFCLVSLGTPDVSLLAGNATIKLPFVNTDVSFVYFLFLGPVTLIALTIYLHIFVGYHSLLSAAQNGRGLPHVFNLQGRLPRYVSGMLLYWLVPCILLAFSYKVAPRPGGSLLVIETVAVTIVLVWVKIRRWSSSQRHNVYRSLWLIEGILVYILILQLGNSSSLLARPLYLFRANLEAQALQDINLQWADLQEANLQEANLQRANLQEANLQRANLQQAKLQRANLQQAKLQRANLQRAVLRKATLQRAVLRKATLQGAVLQQANLWGANLQGATLSIANLQGATLSIANLQGATLQWANLQKADLQEADLQEANLQEANLSGADIRGAVLTKAQNLTPDQVKTACGDKDTRLPDYLGDLTLPPCPE